MEQIKVMDRDEQLNIAATILNMENDFEDDLSDEEVEEMLEREKRAYANNSFVSLEELFQKI